MKLRDAIQLLEQLAAQCTDPSQVELQVYEIAEDREARFEITRGDNVVYLEIH